MHFRRFLGYALKEQRNLKCYNFFRHFSTASTNFSSKESSAYDVIVVGAGHNGLVSAAYLAKSGLRVCVLERRHVIGGAAVTEEIVPGFKFSRASYVLSLLRPKIVEDLELKKYGLKVYLRNPSSYTPLLGKTGKGSSLTLGPDHAETYRQIAQFSEKDAKSFVEYEKQLDDIVTAIDPLLDSPPPYLPSLTSGKIRETLKTLPAIKTLLKSLKTLGKDGDAFYELMTAPTTKILNRWFESEPLKATLATDSVIGAMMSPESQGSGYVLLHHVMGSLEGKKGAWGYVEGGMGAVSQAICNCAMDHGADIFTSKPVKEILTKNDAVQGVVLADGKELHSKAVISNASPKITFLDLIEKNKLPKDLVDSVRAFDFTSPVTKINVALSRLPDFTADPNVQKNEPMPHHQCTIHLNCEHTQLIHDAYLDAQLGMYSKKPMIEMVIPSSKDPTLAPPGAHVCLMFTQYTPYHLKGEGWTEQDKNAYADNVFDIVEQYAPGFKESVVGRDILTPPDLEQVFGLTGGNIFHGSMSLDQLFMTRPTSQLSNYRTPLKGLYLGGSGAHPGGGVMGSPGRLAAQTLLSDFKKL
ncbi:pyridine nucleotide-disulfide oxidoreductase domain-containing protein 2-like [Saccostrea echinata]|uniref:pyridine nucleotide-disulfide oxidoreductase domain-containing protein 2-like n=1 Tax=Saccostrea echinata TaxID=191078 RepID=UPI002A818470|nr:pyridine nucleotide-disulfide oxidoreductase domain-containing protein 2-like [Saccostrea echinata]